MCGIAGILDLRGAGRVDSALLCRMVRKLSHRGPDETGFHCEPNFACGVARLSIVDVAGGQQPLFNEDHSLVVVCNGELYDHQELRHQLAAEGHRFRTLSDVEILPHLYERHAGPGFLDSLNGQFAFILYDRKRGRLIAARDHFGIAPLYHCQVDGLFLFASEIKALLEHPSVPRDVDLRALDQVFSLPGIVSPRTILQSVKSLPAGHFLDIEAQKTDCKEYWDFRFPPAEDAPAWPLCEEQTTSQLASLFENSVERRLLGETPLGVYLSGGLDSSFVAATLRSLWPSAEIPSFSISIEDEGLSERAYQDKVACALHLDHHRLSFSSSEIATRLKKVIYHCECPLKELHNAGAIALSEYTRSHGLKAILSGQGADELFAGYVGYRFDALREEMGTPPASEQEKNIRRHLWGDEDFFYEKDQAAFLPVKKRLYSCRMQDKLGKFGCLEEAAVSHERIRGLHPINRRSYVDCKLRLGDHLLADHGDRMCYANSVEMRHPFLDQDFVSFVMAMPVGMKLRGYEEKYALKQAARQRVPPEIIEREKFGFAVPGTCNLVRQNRPEIDAFLDPERILAQGYFNPAEVSLLKRRYEEPAFRINVPFEDDLLATVITFGMLSDVFELPSL